MREFIEYIEHSNVLSKVFLSIISFFSPLKYLMLIVFIMILIDTYFGVWHSRKKKIKFTSKKLRIGIVSKLIGYNVMLLTTFLIDYAIFNDILYRIFNVEHLISKLITLMIFSIELTSIDEKIRWVKGVGLKEHFRTFVRGISSVTRDYSNIRSIIQGNNQYYGKEYQEDGNNRIEEPISDEQKPL